MTTYAEQVRPYINFENKDEMDKHFNLFRKKFRYDITEKENHVLFTLTGFAMKFPGACKIELNKIADAAGVSASTVKRAIAKACDLGMLKRFNKRKEGGRRQGVTVYQFQRFELQDEPQRLNHRENNEKSCESKKEASKFKLQSLILLLPSLKIFKDTNITKKYDNQKKVDKEIIKKQALLAKIPTALHGLTMYFDNAQDIHYMAGVIFNAKKSIDKNVRIEDHENLFNKTINSVYEYWQRQIKAGNTDYNVFGLMTKAIRELVAKILDGSAYEVPNRTSQVNTPARKFEQAPDWMQVNKALFNNRELVPDWFNDRNEVITDVKTEPTTNDDFEIKRQQTLAKINEL